MFAKLKAKKEEEARLAAAAVTATETAPATAPAATASASRGLTSTGTVPDVQPKGHRAGGGVVETVALPWPAGTAIRSSAQAPPPAAGSAPPEPGGEHRPISAEVRATDYSEAAAAATRQDPAESSSEAARRADGASVLVAVIDDGAQTRDGNTPGPAGSGAGDAEASAMTVAAKDGDGAAAAVSPDSSLQCAGETVGHASALADDAVAAEEGRGPARDSADRFPEATHLPASNATVPPPIPETVVAHQAGPDGEKSADSADGDNVDDDNDDLMAELEAELAENSDMAAPGLSGPPAESAASTVPSPMRKNPFADPLQVVAPTYEPEVVVSPIPVGMVTADEFDKLQRALEAVRSQRDTYQLQVVELEKRAEEKQQQQQQAKSGRSLLGRFRKDKTNSSGNTQQAAADAAELSALRDNVSQLKAEIVLHKETKDQLATELRSTMSDFEDQRATIGTSIATLSAENAALKARLAAAKRGGEGDNDGADADYTDEDGTDRMSVEAAEASLRVELHRQVQYLETKVSRAEAEALEHAHERELLKADLAKAAASIASLTAERNTLQADTVRLNDELSQLIAEGHAASSRIRLADEQVVELRSRLADCEATLEAEVQRTNKAQDRALDAEGRLKLLRDDLDAVRANLAHAEAERAKAVAASSSVVEGLTTANSALSQKLTEHQESVSAKEERLAALASRLADGEANRTALVQGNTPSPHTSPLEGGEAHVSSLQRSMSGTLGVIEAQLVAALKDKTSLQQHLDELMEQRKAFESRIAEVRGELEEVASARDALAQENKIVVDGNTKMSGALAATEAALERERVRAASAETERGSLATRADVSEKLADEASKKITSLKATIDELTSVKVSLEASLAESKAKFSSLADESTSKSSELTGKIESLEAQAAAASDEATRLEKVLSDSEAQRALDQKVSTKMIKDLSKQLQKQKAGPARGASGGVGSGSPMLSKGHRRSTSGPTNRISVAASALAVNDSSAASTPESMHRASAPLDKAGRSVDAAPTTSPAANSAPIVQTRLELRKSSEDSPSGQRSDSRRTGGGSALAGCTSCRKLSRKIEFYESHVKDLTDDVKNKSKLIHSFLLREKKGQLLPPSVAAPPVPPKLLSFTRNNPASELTAEANRKLQQVTEDTLLQNIHLRESLDVLSAQVAALQRDK
mmetsp:Transcript_25229/g.75976  ORF Transcript_25229/g.75976 Transcript_25229/m.75976 type:complete len:1170 (-) Transcript_25229:3-3512(-)